MGFRINTNIAAMNSHSAATMNNRNLDSSLSKLSSGLRINTAADDASGLAIANSLRSQASSLGQAIANGNDAVGLIQTADGALSEYSNILDTIKTKSVQAASDTQNTASRLAIQKDIDALMKELNTIATTTSFNGQKLLSGNYTNKEFQMGANANETAKISISSAETNQIGHTSRNTLAINNPGGGTVALNITSATTGKSIQLKSIDILSNNNPDNGMGALAAEVNRFSGETGISAKAIVETATTGGIQAGSTGTDFAINGITIGSVIVENNDNNGALLTAINNKSTQSGVTATIESGNITLSSSDGRAIKVEGDVVDVFGTSNSAMSTIGRLELVQNGSSDFQISNESVGALGMDITLNADVTTTADSVLGAGSTLITASTLAQGSTVGGETNIDAIASYNIDAKVTAESTITATSVLVDGTTLGGQMVSTNAGTLNSDMLLTAGSTLIAGTTLAAGTVITTAFTDTNTDVWNVGDVLNAQVTTNDDLVLAEDMTLKFASGGATQNTVIAAASTLNTGSKVSFDLTVDADVILEKDMNILTGSSTAAATLLKSGSVIGADITTGADVNVTDDMSILAGSTIIAATIQSAGSTIGGATDIVGNSVLSADMSLKSGSILTAGTILKAGTVLNQDTTAGETGIAFQAGNVLKNDITTAGDLTLTQDMTLLKGSTIFTLSTLEVNDGKTGTLDMGETTNSTLSEIDVTTLEGAMKAIDTVSAAISNLDTIRSGLGSVQNQVISTINNISVTQVNVKAAESNIRDVDFAAESANFSKFNILAQSGSYAMSQANAVQQNVMRLLQ